MLDEKTLESIHEQVAKEVVDIWNNDYAPISKTYCTRCSGYSNDKPKRRCITNVFTMEALCPECWAKDREAKLIKETEELLKPKLDVADFSRL